MSNLSFNAPSLEDLERMLPAYDFEDLIAKGGMGAVYKAKQRSLDRDVAIKILPPEVGQDPLFRESFETEARAMARLNHPNLIGVYDFGAVDEMLYIVMEYVPGKSLYHSSYGIKLDPVQAVELIQGICAGLAHAHENGIIHRDIKPANILLTPKAEPKIGDFGIARPMESKGTGLVMGTPGYTAPEVITSPQVADCRSDLFAVGVILYELMTGQRQEAGAPSPSSRCGCGPGIDEIWLRATHPNPAFRYPNAQAFSAALEDWLLKSKSKGPAKGTPKNQGRTVSQVEFEVKTNWHFVRNLFIIAILIVVIAVVWKQLETARIQRDRANRQLLEEAANRNSKEKADVKQRVAKVSKESIKPISPEGRVNPVTPVAPPEIKRETPIESLERLRIDLANGNRTEMPIGTIRHGDYDFFYVEKPMMWSDAAGYAERFGGHLAIPSSPEDVSWLGQNAPPEGDLWIGAGRSGRSEWSFVDGTLWKLPSLPKGIGSYVGVNRLGLVRAIDSKTFHPFLIQWHRDGSNPASLATALLATRESLNQANAIYPPGTEAFENRHYLYVARPITWQDAAELAEKSGGHLAVAVENTEAGYLAQFADSMNAADGIWLGGFLKSNEWAWTTGEPWKIAKWAEGGIHDKPASGLLIRPDKGWDSQDLAKPASGFIIEWSNDSRSTPSIPEVNTASIGSIDALTARAKELILAADKKRSEQLAVNARSFSWDLDTWLHTLSKNEQNNWQLHIAKLKAVVKNSRVPDAIGADSSIAMSPQMSKIAEFCSQKQRQIDENFLADVNKLRVAYLLKIKNAVSAAEQTGQHALATSLREIFKQASDNEEWISSFEIDAKPAAPVVPVAPSARVTPGVPSAPLAPGAKPQTKLPSEF